MPLVVDQLQLWTIGFKWAGLDPDESWLRIPAPARDNFSTLLDAILNDQLECMSLASEKYQGDDPELAQLHIRYWLDDVYAAVNGQHYNRKLLKHAVIERWAFQDWCERRTIPLPEFWFPPGWTDYRWPSEDYEPIPEAPGTSETEPASEVAINLDATQTSVPGPIASSETENPAQPNLRNVQLAKITCQQIGKVIWKDHPDMTIAAMSKHDLILKYGGGQYYSEEVVRRWVKEVAPAEISAKRGRPKKKNPTGDD